MLDQNTKDQLNQRLLDEKARLENQINRENQEILDMSSDQSNENTYSNHMADDGGMLQDIDRTTLIQRRLEESLHQVDSALKRMEEGSYGLSEVSGKEIPFDRLDAIPWATRLVDE